MSCGACTTPGTPPLPPPRLHRLPITTIPLQSTHNAACKHNAHVGLCTGCPKMAGQQVLGMERRRVARNQWDPRGEGGIPRH